VRVAADDDVDARQLRSQGLVLCIAHVGEQHDLVDALRVQAVDFALGGLAFVEQAGAGVGARCVLGLVGDGEADDADALAATLDHHGGAYAVAADRRARAQRQVGRQQRRAAGGARPQVVDEAAQTGVTRVEFVVAHCHGVEAHLVHQVGIGLAFGEGVVERAGNGVARVQLEDIAVARGQLVDRRHHARKTAYADGDVAARAAGVGGQAQRGAGFVEIGVVVVDVQDCEREVGLGCIRIADATCKRKRAREDGNGRDDGVIHEGPRMDWE